MSGTFEKTNNKCCSSDGCCENKGNWPFRGICLGVPKQKDYDVFKRLIGEVLPAYGCNALVLLIRYRYQFKSHPEVADSEALSHEQAVEIAELCRKNNIRLIPKMNLFGHQSEKERGTEGGLLRAYPQFDETPEQDTVRYCRSLCPTHPEVKNVVFDLIDEIIDAFSADAIHVGMDEVFEIGKCPRCREIPNHELFAGWVNTLHGHIVGERKVEMFMWGDRFLDGTATGYGEWEASINDTWAAVDKVPKDIVICDWHYEKRESYPSVPMFNEKGFRTVVCPWQKADAAQALIEYAHKAGNDKLMGVLATSWCDPGAVARYLCGIDDNVGDIPKNVSENFKRIMQL